MPRPAPGSVLEQHTFTFHSNGITRKWLLSNLSEKLLVRMVKDFSRFYVYIDIYK